MERKLSALPYLGGKSVKGMSAGKWVASLLPYGEGYVEPFAGMLGVLLQREPSKTEIVNDLNSRVVNWWRVVRDSSEELARRLELTPVSREGFDEAYEQVDIHPDPVERARMFTELVTRSVTHGPNPAKYDFVLGFSHFGPRLPSVEKIRGLACRMRSVQLENMDAEKFLKKLYKRERLVVYCDPPYANTRNKTYGHDLDRERFSDIVTSLRGKVAVSGYNDEWDHLGWNRNERASKVSVGNFRKSNDISKGVAGEWDNKRTEVLWTNYETEEMLLE